MISCVLGIPGWIVCGIMSVNDPVFIHRNFRRSEPCRASGCSTSGHLLEKCCETQLEASAKGIKSSRNCVKLQKLFMMVDCACFPPSFQVFPSQDPLDRADFNAVEYINALFPTEQVSNAPKALRLYFLAFYYQILVSPFTIRVT